MNPQLTAFFQQNKTAILGAAAAGVAGLALLQRRKGTSSAPAAAQPAGTMPAAAVVPAGTASAPDNSAYDVYNALQSQLGPILAQQAQATGGGGVTTAPKPIASTLFSPLRTGNYVYQQGANAPAGVFEVESDGSLYHLSAEDWGSIDKNGDVAATKLAPDIGSPFYTQQGNISAANGGSGARAFTTNAQGNYIPYVPKS